VRLSVKVKPLFLIVITQVLLCAQATINPPRVGVVDYYGLRKITPERIQRVLATKEGDPFPHSKGDIEERLEKVQSQMLEKFQAYEKRIADLEKELASAEEQNRDLIRAKIALAKQELEAEFASGRLDWN